MKDRVVRLLLLVIVITGIVFAVIYRDQLNAAVLEQWVEDAGAAGPLVFMLIYALGTVFFFPGSVLTLAGGALFGPFWGTFYNLTAATIGASLSFVLARYVASGWVQQKTGGKLKQLVEGVENEGWRFVAFVRLVPLFPFNLLNYALGVTRIRFSHYVITSYLCMLPGAIGYTYLGYAAREAIAGETDLKQITQLGVISLALIAVVIYLPRIVVLLRLRKKKTKPEASKSE